LAAILLDRGFISKAALLQAIAEYLGHDYEPDLPATLPGDALASLGAGLARVHAVAPLAADETSITVAALDPFELDLASELSFAVGRVIRVRVADPEMVRRLIRQHYGEGDSSLDAALVDLRTQVGEAGSAALSESDIEQLAGQTPVIRFVNHVLAQAVGAGASDLHFEPFETEFRIRCRVDGGLRDLAPPPRHLALPVVSRLKVLAKTHPPEPGRARGGFADFHAADAVWRECRFARP
jgi:type IV pilus assembly protein PilB